jgi:pyruvate-formate lyase-activating enzyme
VTLPNHSGVQKNIFSQGAKKLFQFPDQVNTWMGKGVPVPIALEIHPTERCNHHCPQCQAYFSLERPDVRLRSRTGADLDLSLLDTLWEAPPQSIILSGNTGDPLLHPEIGSLLAKLREKHLPVVLITNGQAFDAEIINHAILTCRGIRISLDAHDADSYTRSHGVRKDAWDATLRNIRELVKRRSELKLTSQECLVGIGYLTKAENKAGMLQAAHIARDAGVDYIQFRPFHYDMTVVQEELIQCENLVTASFQVFSSHQKYSQFGVPQRKYNRCHGAWFFTVLDARGDMYICCHHVGNPQAWVGSLRENSWLGLLHSEKRKEVIGQFEVSNCIRYCRLDSQNEALELCKETQTIPQVTLEPDILYHAPFL